MSLLLATAIFTNATVLLVSRTIFPSLILWFEDEVE